MYGLSPPSETVALVFYLPDAENLKTTGALSTAESLSEICSKAQVPRDDDEIRTGFQEARTRTRLRMYLKRPTAYVDGSMLLDGIVCLI